MFPEQKERFYRFDGFAVDAARRLLLRDDQPVALKPKAIELLVALIENRERVMTKQELLERVWPNQFVEEGNLTVHISALRKALGDLTDERRYLVTIPGSGYQFVGHLLNADPACAELVIEQHTLSRFTVEQKDELDDRTMNAATVADAIVIPVSQIAPNGRAAQAQLADAAAVLQQSHFAVPTHTRRVWVRNSIAAAILVGLLIASIFAFRLYSQKQTQLASASPHGASGMTSRHLTFDGKVSRAMLSPDGKYFVYGVGHNGMESIWFGHVNGGDPVQLRPESIYYGLVTFAPDGGSIFYELRGTLFQMPVLGGPPQKVLDGVGAQFSISADGKRVAFVRDDTERRVSSLIIANLDGSGERELVALPSGRGFSSYGPAWSADGSMLAIGAASQTVTNQDVVLSVQLADGTLKQVNPQTWDQISKVAWLHDGSGIVFHARGPQSDFHIWLADYPQGDLHCITSDLNRYGRASVSVSDDGKSLLTVRGEGLSSIWLGPAADLKRLGEINKENSGAGFSWTPDGKIVYVSLLNNSYSLSMMNADGSGVRQITPAGFTDTFPRVTSDGRYIVFQSNRSGGAEIWRVNLDGSDLRQLTTGGGGSHSDVTPDGKWVLYAASEDGRTAIWKVSIDGGPPERITDKTSDWPRVSPDGKLLACAYDDKSISSHTQLVILSLADGKLRYHFDLASSATFNNGVSWSPDGSAVNYRDYGSGLWRQPVSGRAPEKWTDLPDKRTYFFDWSRDGKQFAVAYDDEVRDAVLISNFR